MTLDSVLSECHICEKNNPDKMCNIKNIYEIMNANNNLSNANGKNLYFEEPLTMSRLPIPPITISLLSNSSSSEDSDESPDYHLDNVDNMFETVLKKCVSNSKNKATNNTIYGITKEELFQRTLLDMSMSSSDESVTDDYKTAVISYDTSRNQSEQTKKRKIGCGEDEQLSSLFNVYVPSSTKRNKRQKRKRRTTATSKSHKSRPVVDDRINKIVGIPTVELSKIVLHKEVQSNTETLYCYCRRPYDELSSMIACDRQNCRMEWFHFDCVGIAVTPEGNWYCPDCR